jgi:S-layer protein
LTVSNFEVLKLSAATGGATAINMANADGMNSLDTNGVTGGALTVTNAAADFTFTQRADLAGASSIALASDTGTSDNVNLKYTALDGFTSGAALTIANVESLKITTTDGNAVAQTALIVTPITAAAATTVTVGGNMGVSLIGGMTQTTLTSLDASGLTASGAFGGLTFTSGALAAAATVKGGAAGTNVVDFSAATKVVTYTGGTGADTLNFPTANTQANVITLGNGANTVNGATNANGANTITGGTGVDNIFVGTGGNTINLGGGTSANSVTVGAAAGLNVITATSTGVDTMGFTGIQTAAGFYTSLTGWSKGDIINFTGAGTVASEATLGAKITLGTAVNFANYLDAAVAGNATDALNWFQFNGNTYITVDNSTNATFADGVDTVIELVGLVDLSGAVNAAGVLTLA